MTTGLDIEQHYDTIVGIVYTKFAPKVDEPDDLLQDVLTRLTVQNAGTSPYDPEKSCPSTYVHLVANSVFKNSLRTPEKNDAGLRLPHKDTACTKERPTIDWTNLGRQGFGKYLRAKTAFDDTRPRRVYLLLRMGYTKREICRALDETMYQINKEKRFLVEQANAYLETE